MHVVQQVVARHPVLRTSFDLKNYSEPLQLVHENAFLQVEEHDLCRLSWAEQERALAEWLDAETTRLFDLSRPPLLRLHVHRRTDQIFQFGLTENHAILDGWSINSTLAEIFQAYFAHLDRESLPAEPSARTSYRDFVVEERAAIESEECRSYWMTKLRNSTMTRLPRWPGRYGTAATSEIHSVTQRSPRPAPGLKQVARRSPCHSRVCCSRAPPVVSLWAARGRCLWPDLQRPIGGVRRRAGARFVPNAVPFRHSLRGGTWSQLVREVFQIEVEFLPYRRYPLAQMQKIWIESIRDQSGLQPFPRAAPGALSRRLDYQDLRRSEPTDLTCSVGFYQQPLSGQLH